MIIVLFIITLISHFFFLYYYLNVFPFMTSNTYVLYIVTTFLVLISLYCFYKRKFIYSIAFMTIYGLCYFMIFFISIIIHGTTSNYLIVALIMISLLLMLMYIAICIYAYIQDEIKRKNYVLQIENNINNAYVHQLQHEYNEFLYRIKNSIQLDDKQKTLNLIDQQAQRNIAIQPIVSNNININTLFHYISHQYQDNQVSFQYFMCKIDGHQWKEDYTLFLYQILTLFNQKGNDITITIQTKDNHYILMIQSRIALSKKHFKYKTTIKHVNDAYIYTTYLPLS